MKRFLQTPFWAEFKACHGWAPLYFVEDLENERSLKPCTLSQAQTEDKQTVVSVLTRSFSLAKLKFSLAYIPMYPETKNKDGHLASEEEKKAYLEHLISLADILRPHLPSNTLFVRFDPPLDFDTLEERKAMQELSVKGIKKSHVDIQPPDTTVLDLSKSEDELLSAMKNKWRYNIRLASKKGVSVSKHFASDPDFDRYFDIFFSLFKETSERDGVQFHARDYYVDLLKRGAPDSADREKPLISLYLASHEEDYLAGIITLFFKGEAVYLYGASGNKKRNYMPAYLLQWTAIQDAKAYGCPSYDFYGMPPTGDEGHPMHGLYLFKTGFGGKIIHRAGSFDIPLKKTYALYVVAEKLRAWFHKTLLKKLRGR